jgi:hypothetical protein
METCDLCGEYTKVTKRRYYNFAGSHISCALLWVDSTFSFDYVCQRCNMALKIKESIEHEANRMKEVKKRKEWVKEREQLLKGECKEV